ncbi:MAG: ADP-ribosylglycohydrolase family protein [Saprospiraceae bacterium]|nr:MAG: ADP-ribosylation/Crystallin J1 [Bacteroidetes bacterium OLB9]MCO6464928.1 ADP-ribosylglycohydrolase family protein [Saprospiraceae bacterium]MCZ2337468.1 ADP-ribosylglycohydrolase family protein [Chitinophagales bacterium]
MIDTTQEIYDFVKAVLFGVATGDAVGVPYEFRSREQMRLHPATDMVGYGTYDLPPGSWSDDSSLTFCLAEALTDDGYNLRTIAQYFTRWCYQAWWTPYGHVFDIGITTSQAIHRLRQILNSATDDLPLIALKHSGNDRDNGNGSLMRILPLVFYIRGLSDAEQFDIISTVSSLTHPHIRASMSCFIYLKMAEKLMSGVEKEVAYIETRKEISAFWGDHGFPEDEKKHFAKVIQNDIRDTQLYDIKTGGYVIESLESCFWFFMQKDSYRDTVLSIINLGHDTDTSAAIVGGLAGICYGFEDIPIEWVKQLARKDDIKLLADRFARKLKS